MPCQYTNQSDRIQVVTIINRDQFIERVVFPQQTLNFETDSNSYLEVYTYTPITMMLADKIRCDRLCN